MQSIEGAVCSDAVLSEPQSSYLKRAKEFLMGQMDYSKRIKRASFQMRFLR